MPVKPRQKEVLTGYIFIEKEVTPRSHRFEG